MAAISVESTFIVVAANASTIAAPAHTQRLYAFGAVRIIAFTPKSVLAAGTNDNGFSGGSTGYEHSSSHP